MSPSRNPENKLLEVEGVEVTYDTVEVAQIFRKTRQWVLFCLKNELFVDKDGVPLKLKQVGNKNSYVWTASNVRDAAISLYNRRRMKDINELKRIIRRLIKDTGEINDRY